MVFTPEQAQRATQFLATFVTPDSQEAVNEQLNKNEEWGWSQSHFDQDVQRDLSASYSTSLDSASSRLLASRLPVEEKAGLFAHQLDLHEKSLTSLYAISKSMGEEANMQIQEDIAADLMWTRARRTGFNAFLANAQTA